MTERKTAMIEIYFTDLTPEKQQEILDAWGENGNYDMFPIVELPEYEGEELE